MLEIKFEQPFSLRMEVMETDDHVPSMRVATTIVITQFQHIFTYQGAFWLECASWSDFADALDDSSRDPVLKDMGEHFVLSIRKIQEKKIISWEFTKTDINGAKKTTVAFSAEIDDDMLGRIKREFTEFPAWW